MKKRLTITLTAGLLAGCSQTAYRESADLQVNDLLRDRTSSTLGYRPDVEVSTNIPLKPSKEAYAKVPVTPLPPPTTAPIDRQAPAEPAPAPLGPDPKLKDPLPATETLGAGSNTALRERLDRLRVLGPPAPGQHQQRFDLFGILAFAVQHSREYQQQMESLYLQALDVTLARHMFDLRPFARQSLTYEGDNKDVDRRSALAAANSAGVRQKLPYGGEVAAETVVRFVQALNDNSANGEDASVALTGSLPLLRGAGMINLEGLISSERSLIYEIRGFEDYRRSFVVNISSQYFRLLEQQQGLVNRLSNVANTQSLTERTQALYDAGRLNYLEVQRSIQSQISAENDLINAEEAYQNAVENFKLTVGMPITEPMDVAAVELDVNIPTASEEDAVALALQYRLDFRTSADRVDDARRGLSNAQNGLLPQLDLSASARANNTPGQPASDVNANTGTFSAGLTLDLPIDRVAERNAFRAALINLDAAQRNHLGKRDQIINEVRSDLRAIRAARASVELQRQGIELAERRLELSNTMLVLGRGEARDVVEAQTSLLDAQNRYEQARSQLQIRVLEYMRDTGTLRVDPRAGSIGRAMARSEATSPSPIPQLPSP